MNALLPFPPDAAAAMSPLWLATLIFFGTFVLEDAAVVGAGLLLDAGSLNWPLAFFACFLGI